MKRISFLLIAAIICFVAFSCKKDNNTTTTPVVPPDSLLVKKNWKIQTITYAVSNKLYYYTRGGAGNNVDLSNDAISFNKDFTGTYSNPIGSFNTTWQFTDVAKTNMKITIMNYDKGGAKPGVNLILTWENVALTSTSLRYAEYYAYSDGTAAVASATRIPL